MYLCLVGFTDRLPSLEVQLHPSSVFASHDIESGMVSTQRLIVVGGDYTKPDQTQANSALFRQHDGGLHGPPPRPHPTATAPPSPTTQTKTWITVGPNGTDISTDDGRNWRALHPDPKFNEPPTPTSTGTPSRFPTPSARTDASARSGPPHSSPRNRPSGSSGRILFAPKAGHDTVIRLRVTGC